MDITYLADYMETVFTFVSVFVFSCQRDEYILRIRLKFHVWGNDGVAVKLVFQYFCFHVSILFFCR